MLALSALFHRTVNDGLPSFDQNERKNQKYTIIAQTYLFANKIYMWHQARHERIYINGIYVQDYKNRFATPPCTCEFSYFESTVPVSDVQVCVYTQLTDYVHIKNELWTNDCLLTIFHTNGFDINLHGRCNYRIKTICTHSFACIYLHIYIYIYIFTHTTLV